jgi:cytosine/adenosine deaminase-related metal-dependent hydrolase
MGRPSGLLLSISALLAAVLSPAAAAKNGSTLFKGGTIIAFNEKKQDLDIIRGGSLLISDGIISAITEGAYDKPLPPGTEIVDATGDILTPGFIDTHRHGWQTAYRTIGSNTTLAEYFNRYGEFAADGIWSADDVYVSQLTGLYEALNAGVTTTLDHAHHTWSKATTDAGVQASIDSGARVFWCFGFHNVSNFPFEQQLAKFQELADSRRFSGQASSLGIAYDAFNPGSAQQTESIIQLAM